MKYPMVNYGDSWYGFYRRYPEIFLKDMYGIKLLPYQVAILRLYIKGYKYNDNSRTRI